MRTGTNEAESQAGSDIKQLLEKRVAETTQFLAQSAKQFTDWYRESHASSMKDQCPQGIPSCLWIELQNQIKEDGSLVEFISLSRAEWLGRLAHYFETRKHPSFPEARQSVKALYEPHIKEYNRRFTEIYSKCTDQELIDGNLGDDVYKEFHRLNKRRNPAWFTELQVLRGASIESTIVGLWLPLGLWLYSSGDACRILSDVLDNLPRLVMPLSYYLEPRTPITCDDRVIALLGSSKPMRKIGPHHVDSAVHRNGLYRINPPPWRLP